MATVQATTRGQTSFFTGSAPRARMASICSVTFIEPSSAVVLAAVLSDPFREVEGVESLGLILSGGNVSLDKLPF